MLSSWRKFGLVLAIVMVLTVALAPVASAGGPVYYWVQRGDNLTTIAARHGVSASAIAAANGISNWNRIYAGQRLLIPGAAAPAPVVSSTGYYVVQRGDTLGSIAARFGTNYWALAQLNGLANPNCVYVGQLLRVRAATACTYCPPPPACVACPTVPAPAPAPYTFGPWVADFYANTGLSGAPTLERQDAAINFNWGWNPPAAGMPNFNWTARWTHTGYMDGGTWRAQAAVDDGIRVYVDGVRIIDSWQVQALTNFSQDYVVNAGQHTITVEYWQAQGVAELHFGNFRIQ